MVDEAPIPEQAPVEIVPSAETHVNIVDPSTGEFNSIPKAQLQQATDLGYEIADPEAVTRHFKEQQYGTPGQQATAGLEGVAKGVAGPVATTTERMLGVEPEAIESRAEVNPVTSTVGEIAGLVAPSIIAPEMEAFTQAGILGKAGEAAAHIAGLGEAATPMAKIGSAIVKGAAENVLYQGGAEAGKVVLRPEEVLKDPGTAVETAVTDMGLAAMLGGGLGGAASGTSALWKATLGNKLSGSLKAISERLGGIEGHVADPVPDAITKTGLDIPPEVRATLSKYPEVRQMAKTLEQSDTTGAGLAYQESLTKFKDGLSDVLSRTLGKEPSQIPQELSKYNIGKQIGNTLADEYHAQVNPVGKEFENYKNRYGGTELPGDVTTTTEVPLTAEEMAYGRKYTPDTVKNMEPGAISQAMSQLGHMADSQGWSASPSSDIMREVNRVMKELPNLKTVRDLTSYIEQVGNNMQSDPLNGPLRRAGGIIKGILRDTEGNVVGNAVGSEEGAAALEKFRQARKAWAAQAELKEAIDSRLHAKGSTSGYAKSLREMAQTDGESVLRRLSGTGDADVLQVLQKSFPKTAELIKQYHLDNLLSMAASKAKGDQAVNPAALLSAIQKLSPEIRNFALTPEMLEKTGAVGTLLDEFNKLPHNFSNTARTMDKLTQYLPGSALGLIAMMGTHNPVAAALVAGLTKYVAKDAPDAVRLATLKFLGSDRPIDAGAFKTAVDFIHSAVKGESIANRAVKNLFRAESEVIPEHMVPKEKDRAKLDKHAQALQGNAEGLFQLGNKSSHYVPEHGEAMGNTAATAVAYINSQRPISPRNAPLDTTSKPNAVQQSAFNRVLNIAQQPLSILTHVKNGSVTSKDVTAIQTMYPSLYKSLSSKVLQQVMDQSHKGINIPYNSRLSLSVFLGQPLDSTMTQRGILSAQPAPKVLPQQRPESMSKPKKGTANLSKMSKSYSTEDQAAEGRRLKD